VAGLALGVNNPPQSKRIELARHPSLKAETRYNSDNQTPFQLCRVYNGTGGALTANRPYLLTFAGTSTTVENPRVTALAAQAGVQNHVVIAHEAIPDASWGWVCYQGYHDCGIEGTTDVAAGDFLKVDAATSTAGLIKDGTSRTQQSCAIACEAQADNSVVAKRVYLFGGPCLTSTAVAGSTQVLTSAAASDIPLTLTANASQTGNMFVVENSGNTDQVVVDSSFRLGVGRVSSLTYKAEVMGTGDNTTSGAARVANSNNSANAGAVVQFEAADSDGLVGAFPSSHTGISSTFADRMVVRAGTGAAGLTLAALSAGQDIVMRVPTLGAIVTLSASGITLADAANIVLNATTGTKIGTATTQKIGFWNATPVVQRAAYTQTFATADRTHAARTATTLTVTDGAGTNDGTIGAITADASVIAAVQELAAAINALIVDLADTAACVNALIDDSQAIGFCA